MADDAVNDLPSVLTITEMLLGQVVDKRDQLLPEDLREPAKKAWDEFRFKDRHLIRESRDLPTVTLETVGLAGEQVAFKFAIYNRVLKAFRNKKDLANLKMLLRITDEVLDSLVEVLTIAEPLKIMNENLILGLDLVQEESGENKVNLDSQLNEFDI